MTVFIPGTRVQCEYRYENQGTVLSDTDPRAWNGQFTTEEEVAAHLEREKKLSWRLNSQYGMPIVRDTRVPVLWDFGKVYWDSADSLYQI